MASHLIAVLCGIAAGVIYYVACERAESNTPIAVRRTIKTILVTGWLSISVLCAIVYGITMIALVLSLEIALAFELTLLVALVRDLIRENRAEKEDESWSETS